MSATLAEDLRHDEDFSLLTQDDVLNAMDTVGQELHFLRFFYNFMKDLCSQGGTDEVFYATEQYREENGEPPKPYGDV